MVALSEVGAEPAPFRWTAERILALVECGVIEEGRGVELIDGTIFTDPPQGAAHFVVFMALQRLFGGAGLVAKGLMVGPTVIVSDHNVFDPEFALLRPEALRLRRLPRGDEVLWVVEVSVTSRRIDLGPKKAAYAKAGIPDYWVFDATGRGIWTFSDPADGAYRGERFVPVGEPVTVPVLGATLDTGVVFPPV